MRRFPALSLFSGHHGHLGLSAALSVEEECTLAPGTVRTETAVQAVHWYMIFSLLQTLSLFPSVSLDIHLGFSFLKVRLSLMPQTLFQWGKHAVPQYTEWQANCTFTNEACIPGHILTPN